MSENIDVSSILSKKAMIARLQTGSWSGRVTDKAITQEVTNLKNAKDGVTSVTKAIIDKKHLKNIRDIISSMKRFHNEQTMPWDNNGGRLLPSTQFAAYNNQIRSSKQELEEAVNLFINQYQNYISEASESLGDMFNNADYPSTDEIQKKFAIEAIFDKVPEAEDFRTDIPEDEQERIKNRIARRVEEQYSDSMKRIWLRIFKAVEHMNERLSEENSIFRDSLVNNVKQLVQVLPELNVMNNQNLTDMTEELKTKLCGYTPEDLRRNKVLRREIVEGSQEIIDKIKDTEVLGE